MELLQPLGLVALVTLPAIVALYFLRQRQQPRRVGSLMLWAKARQQILRGRPWERFRPSWLLLLQLLVAAAIAATLARPACVAEGVESERLVIVLDASASMGALDGAPRRLDVAIERAEATLETAPEGSEVALLSAGRLTRVVEPFTTDRGKVRQALAALRERGPDATAASLKEALLLAMQLRGDPQEGRIVLISDGANLTERLPATGGNTDFIGVGEGDANLGIVTFELRRAPSQRFSAAVVTVVANTGSAPLAAHLRVELDGAPLEAHRVELAPGATRTVTLPVTADQGVLHATLEALPAPGGGEARDLLPLDDEAWAVIAPDRPLRVLTVGANPLTLRALQANPRLEIEPRPADGWTGSSDADVVLFEGTFPATIPQGRFLAIAPPPGNPLLDYSGEEVQAPRIASWDRGHPILYGLELGDLRFGAVPRVVPQNAFSPLAEFQGQGGPFLLAARTPGWRGVVITPPLLASDLPLRVAFPVLLYNALGWLSPGGEQGAALTLKAGEPLTLPALPGDQVQIKRPSGEVERAEVQTAGSDGAWLFTDTRQLGLTTLTRSRPGSEDLTLTFASSLVDREESSILPVAALELPGGGELRAQDRVARVEPFDAPLLAGALLLLGLEWALFLYRQRRQA